MSIALNELTVQNSITTGEKFIVAGANSEVQIDYSVLAKAIIEQWTGSSLGGSNQSLKTVIDEISESYIPFTIPSASVITSGTDLDTITAPGVYGCKNNIASTLVNCPTTSGFRLTVTNLGSLTSGAYAYVLQEIQPYNSTRVYRRRGATGSVADVWTFGKWETDLGVVVDSFGTNGWEEVENNYFTTDRGDNTTGVCKVFKQGGWAMVLIDGRIIAAPSGWQSIGKVEKAFSIAVTNVLTNNGNVVRLRVTTNGDLQMAYSGEVPAVIGTTFFYPMAVT